MFRKGLIVAAGLSCLVLTPGVMSSHPTAKPIHPTLSVSPLPTHVGDALGFTGCGYPANTGILIGVMSPYAASGFGAISDANGCINSATFDTYTAEQAGTYTASTYLSGQKRALVSLTFSVS